jgi:glycosyltransferase involved in cell wall biosynthesis
MARGERVIAISKFVADHATSVYGVGPDRLRTIRRGVDLEIFDPARVGPRRIISLARQWLLLDGAAVVMPPGRLTPMEGRTQLFIAAIAGLAGPTYVGLLVGSEQRRGFPTRVRDRNRAVRARGLFRIVEDCRDRPAAYMLADVVVSASSDPEGFGLIIVEAQATRRPMVATDHGGARETIVPGVTGWLARAGARSRRSCPAHR